MRRFQFSLADLMLAMSLAGVFAAWGNYALDAREKAAQTKCTNRLIIGNGARYFPPAELWDDSHF